MSFLDKLRELISPDKRGAFDYAVRDVLEVAEHIPGKIGDVAEVVGNILDARERVRNAPAQIVAQAGVTGVMPEDEFNRRVLAVLDAHEAELAEKAAAAEQARNAEV